MRFLGFFIVILFSAFILESCNRDRPEVTPESGKIVSLSLDLSRFVIESENLSNRIANEISPSDIYFLEVVVSTVTDSIYYGTKYATGVFNVMPDSISLDLISGKNYSILFKAKVEYDFEGHFGLAPHNPHTSEDFNITNEIKYGTLAQSLNHGINYYCVFANSDSSSHTCSYHPELDQYVSWVYVSSEDLTAGTIPQPVFRRDVCAWKLIVENLNPEDSLAISIDNNNTPNHFINSDTAYGRIMLMDGPSYFGDENSTSVLLKVLRYYKANGSVFEETLYSNNVGINRLERKVFKIKFAVDSSSNSGTTLPLELFSEELINGDTILIQG